MTVTLALTERVRTTPRLVAAVILVASVAILGAALLSQYVGGLQPCVLCLYQRVPYAVTIAIGVLGLIFAGSLGSRGMAAAAGACALAFVIGAGIAAFHVGVEQHWWEGTSACGTTLGGAGQSLDELRRQLLEQPVVRCDEIAWSLFGISMAGYNFLVSLALAAGSFWAAWQLARG
jgi:disulfide bond formation protein DsbB